MTRLDGSLEFAIEADAAQNYSAHGSAGFFEELRLRLLLSIHRTVDHVRLGLTHVMSIVAAQYAPETSLHVPARPYPYHKAILPYKHSYTC